MLNLFQHRVPITPMIAIKILKQVQDDGQ